MIAPWFVDVHDERILEFNLLEFVLSIPDDEVSLFQRCIDRWGIWYESMLVE